MKRTAFARKPPVLDILAERRQREQERNRRMAALLDSVALMPTRKAVMARASDKPTNPVAPKLEDRKSQAIRDSARDEDCLIRLPGCDGGGETTVWCHLPEAVAGRGMGLKGIDVLGAYGCRSCHDIADRRAPRPAGMTKHDVALAFYRGMARSIAKLMQRGLA